MAEQTSQDPIRARLLAAAFVVASRLGLRRLTISAVATEAGLSRVTLYKSFGSRDQLIAALVAHEADALAERVLRRVDREHDLASALHSAIIATISEARAHALLDRLVSCEPESLLPLLTSASSPVAQAVTQMVAQVINEWDLPEGTEAVAADALTRLLISYAVAPPVPSAHEIATTLTRLLIDPRWGLDEGSGSA